MPDWRELRRLITGQTFSYHPLQALRGHPPAFSLSHRFVDAGTVSQCREGHQASDPVARCAVHYDRFSINVRENPGQRRRVVSVNPSAAATGME